MDRADLAGVQEPVHGAAADAEPAGGLDDGQQHPLVGHDVDIDDLLRHGGSPPRLRCDEHELEVAGSARAPVELRPHRLQVVVDELLDVALVARLRPAARLVLPLRLLRLVDLLLEPAAPQAEDATLLARDHRDERAVAAAHRPGERHQVELPAEVHGVVDPAGPAKHAASCAAAGPVSVSDSRDSGTVQPLPMTFQFSSSPLCWALAGLTQPSTV